MYHLYFDDRSTDSGLNADRTVWSNSSAGIGLEAQVYLGNSAVFPNPDAPSFGPENWDGGFHFHVPRVQREKVFDLRDIYELS